jgi:predicted HAD superfamily phosphohydrolase
MGRRAKLTPGAIELVTKLKSQGWHVFCIGTSYKQYASPITQRLGIPGENVACTSFPLMQIRQLLGRSEFLLVDQAEQGIVSLTSLLPMTRE